MKDRSLKTLEFDKILLQLEAFAASSDAKAAARTLVPMTDIAAIEEALIQTNDALSRIFAKGCASFAGIRDVRESCKRLEVGSTLTMRELLDINSLLTTATNVLGHYEETTDSLTGFFNSLTPLPNLQRQITQCIISEEEMSDDASPTLHDIRRQKRVCADRIHTELNKLLNNTTTRGYLQECVITTRQGRYCLPVKAEYRSQVSGMIHDQSSTGSTLFIEPAAVVKLNNDIRELELDEQKEIEVILANLSASAADHRDDLIANYTVLIQLDFIFAKAQLARKMKATCPKMNTDNRINIIEGRHPLIPADSVVPIDIYLGKDFNLLIITGPNTGGKTVSLKTVGLFTLMAQAGLNIPAREHSELAVFDRIFADIGDEQSIEQSLSTFSSHMTHTVDILKEANEHSLILFDEIGAGTDPTEGAALAISILNDLHQRGVTTMATTHYSEIKVYALSTDGVENASCEFDVASLRPTYRLLIGVPGKSNAFAISKRLGLPEYLIDDATSRINAEDIKFEDLLTDLEQSRITIEQEREELAAYKEEVARLKQELSHKSKRLDERTDKIIRKANEQAADILREAKEFADETIKTMNKHGMSVAELEKQRTAVRDKMNKRQEKLKIKENTTTDSSVKSHKSTKLSDFIPGLPVRIISMNVIGSVVGSPSTRGEVMVSMGNSGMTTKVKISNLEILDNYKDPSETAAKSSAKFGGSGHLKMNKSANISPEINLLGLTVDEAVAKLDKYLDDAYIAKLGQVRIVHGKGTGALRNGVTAYLRGIPYIKSFRLGEVGEGDAGVTIVEFK